jgi:8-oxo-dGTP pyrophosphatase MutT (NUDIX family)
MLAMYQRITDLYEHVGQPIFTNFRPDDLDEHIPNRGAAFVLADLDGKIVLIRRKPHPDHPDLERYWWLPGGGLEQGERIIDAAIREFQEETGLTIQIDRVLVAALHRSGRWFYFFLRGHVNGGTLTVDSDPDQTTAEAHCFAPSEIPDLELWSDIDKIVLTKEGFAAYNIDDLLTKRGLKEQNIEE